MTLWRADRADPATREAVRRALAPVLDALGCGLSLLHTSLLPQGWTFEVCRGNRGQDQPCAWVRVINRAGQYVYVTWSEPGWSLAGLAVASHQMHAEEPWGSAAGQPELEAVAAALLLGGYVGLGGYAGRRSR